MDEILPDNDKIIYQCDESGNQVAYLRKDQARKLEIAKLERVLKDAGIPVIYWTRNFKDHQDKNLDPLKKSLLFADLLLRKPGEEVSWDPRGLYYWGPHSNGKTTMACCLAKKLLYHKKKVKFVLASDVIDLLLKCSGLVVSEEFLAKRKEFDNLDLLIIDDAFDHQKSIFWKKNPDLILAEWDRFLRSVLYSGTRLILTGNTPPDQIRSLYNSAIFELIDRSCEYLYFPDSLR